jgi:hypothetical protein
MESKNRVTTLLGGIGDVPNVKGAVPAPFHFHPDLTLFMVANSMGRDMATANLHAIIVHLQIAAGSNGMPVVSTLDVKDYKGEDDGKKRAEDSSSESKSVDLKTVKNVYVLPDGKLAVDKFPNIPWSPALLSKNFSKEVIAAHDAYNASEASLVAAFGLLAIYQNKKIRNFKSFTKFTEVELDQDPMDKVLSYFSRVLPVIATLDAFKKIRSANPYFRYHTQPASTPDLCAKFLDAMATSGMAKLISASVVFQDEKGEEKKGTLMNLVTKIRDTATKLEEVAKIPSTLIFMTAVWIKAWKIDIDEWYQGEKAISSSSTVVYNRLFQIFIKIKEKSLTAIPDSTVEIEKELLSVFSPSLQT